MSAVPDVVHEVVSSPGEGLDGETRQFMEQRFGHDFSRVRIHADSRAAASAEAVQAEAYTVGRDVVFARGRYQPRSTDGRHLLAHELAHTLQQGQRAGGRAETISSPDDLHERAAARAAEEVIGGAPVKENARDVDGPDARSSLQRQEATVPSPAVETAPESPDEEGMEVGGLVMLLPHAQVNAFDAGPGAHRPLSLSAPTVQRLGSSCHDPSTMRKVTSGAFELGKTLDDYYPDLVGTDTWGSNKTAGPFDNGTRAGSSVQLIGEYPSPCALGTESNFTLGQTATIVRMRGDGKKLRENGKPLEGQTLNDIARSGRDQSKAPFRQAVGFAVSMADPISGAPYSMFSSYELEVNLTASITGKDGSASVDWGVTVESSGGKVTKNTVR